MTQKEIRDIAAYWGARIKTNLTCDGASVVGAVSLALLEEGILMRDAVIQLRSIQSLTDEEVFTLAGLALGGEVDRLVCQVERFTSEYFEPVYFKEYQLRTDGSHYFHDWCISEKGLFGSGDGSDGNEVYTQGEAAVFAYLQFIGVYVPGTIDPQYVELLP